MFLFVGVFARICRIVSHFLSNFIFLFFNKMLSNLTFLILLTIGFFVVGYLGATDTIPDTKWFISLKKPNDYPSNKTFGIVWPFLYLLLIFAFSLSYNSAISDNAKIVIIIFAILQLGLQYMWSNTFFKNQMVSSGLTIIGLLVLLTVLQIIYIYNFTTSSYSFFLFVPYLAWILYAFYLNSSIKNLNPNQK